VLLCCTSVLSETDALQHLRDSYRRYIDPVKPRKTCQTQHRLEAAQVALVKAGLLLAARRESGATAEEVAVAEAFEEEMRQLVVWRRQEALVICQPGLSPEAAANFSETVGAVDAVLMRRPACEAVAAVAAVQAADTTPAVAFSSQNPGGEECGSSSSSHLDPPTSVARQPDREAPQPMTCLTKDSHMPCIL
jgi:hypothetical protein